MWSSTTRLRRIKNVCVWSGSCLSTALTVTRQIYEPSPTIVALLLLVVCARCARLSPSPHVHICFHIPMSTVFSKNALLWGCYQWCGSASQDRRLSTKYCIKPPISIKYYAQSSTSYKTWVDSWYCLSYRREAAQRSLVYWCSQSSQHRFTELQKSIISRFNS